MSIRISAALATAMMAATIAAAEAPVISVSSTAQLVSAITTVPDGGIIELASGVYTAPPVGFQILEPDKSFTIRAAVAGGAVLDGAGNRPILLYQSDNLAERGWVHFDGLAFENGYSTQVALAGGVTLAGAAATFTDCSFENNNSSPSTGIGGSGGGAGLIEGSVGFFFDCIWRDNRSSSQAGGLFVGGESTAFIHASRFIRNRTNFANHRVNALGGGLLVFNSRVMVTNTRFEENESGFAGGGLWVIGNWNEQTTDPQSFVTVANCSFVDNQAMNHPTVTTNSPTEGGGIHAENQVTVIIFNSRFVNNTAHLGGGISMYRAEFEVHDSVFRGNVGVDTVVRGRGGAIKASSLDTTGDGNINRRTARLVIADSFIQGSYGGVETASQLGGGLFVAGDTNRMYGQGGVSQMGTVAENRMEVDVTNVVFSELDVDEIVPGTSAGGGIYGELVDLEMTDCLFMDSNAIGSEGRGGAAGFLTESSVQITDTTFVRNAADLEGGAMYVIGSELQMDDCSFIGNEVSPGVAETDPNSRGAAIFSSVQAGKQLSVTGVVANSSFVDNIGLPIYDNDRTLDDGGFINDLRYNNNLFYNTTFGDKMYKDSVAGHFGITTSELNALIIDRDSSTVGNCEPPNPAVPPECTDKSLVNNSQLGSEPNSAMLLPVPSSIIDEVAAGDSASSTEAFLGYAWSGSSATLDGQPLSLKSGFVVSDIGVHTLAVGGQNAVAEIFDADEPMAALTADPISIPGGGSSTLSWQTVAGSFLDSGIDWDVDTGGAASGSQVVQPPETRTFRFVTGTEQGGAVATTTVYVDDAPVVPIFEDGFESGDTSAWSSVAAN